MNKLIGGPLDGAVTTATDPHISVYISKDGTRMARYDRTGDFNYKFVVTFDQSEVEKCGESDS